MTSPCTDACWLRALKACVWQRERCGGHRKRGMAPYFPLCPCVSCIRHTASLPQHSGGILVAAVTTFSPGQEETTEPALLHAGVAMADVEHIGVVHACRPPSLENLARQGVLPSDYSCLITVFPFYPPPPTCPTGDIHP